MYKSVVRIGGYIIAVIAGLVSLLIVIILATGYFVTLPDELVTSAGHKRNISQYIEMSDGVKIAVDIWFPESTKNNVQYPTLMKMTRYWRAKERTALQRGLIALDVGLGNQADILDERTQWFNEADYVVIHVDARGTGASFGRRDIEWSPEEIGDYGEILKWIAQQPWSNGKVGSYGISYVANTAEMIMTTARPELKVVAPLYGDFDPFLGLIQPGGAQNMFLDNWGDVTHAMDQNDLCTLANAQGVECWLTKLLMTGVKPVAGHEDLLALAVEEHKHNIHNGSAGNALKYSDDQWASSGFNMQDVAPYGAKSIIEASDVPMIVSVGWSDAATVEGALSRYLTFSNDQHLLIGPYSHGGKHDTDPYLPVDKSVSPSWYQQYQNIIAYFDAFLKGSAQGLTPSKQISYYTLGANKWSTTEVWPPEGFVNKAFYFSDDHQLIDSISETALSSDVYDVDFSAATGLSSRWHTNLSAGDVIYADRFQQGQKLLNYTSAPLEQPIEITGTGVVTLHVSSTTKDNMFIAYLEDVALDGQVTYITEGVIRADNRAIADPENLPYKVLGVAHSYLRQDAKPMIPGETTEIVFNLQPISVQVKAGHRIRVSIAGADKTMFKRWPIQGESQWTIGKGGDKASRIELPFKVIN
jgi:putative CocE/NonD family hydrolase